MPSPIDEEFRLLRVLDVSRCASEFDQSDFNPRMATDGLATRHAEGFANVVGSLDRNVNQRVIATDSADATNRSLNEVSVVVELMAPLKVAVALSLAGTPELRVDVAIGFLGGRDDARQ